MANRIVKDVEVKMPRTMSGERQLFHGFRSYAAIKRLREGLTIYAVMEWLGWEDADTMMRHLKKENVSDGKAA